MPVLQNVSWTVTGSRRIGLIGPNGAGKTTLLRLISGEIEQDEGTVSAGGLTIGYLRQETQEQGTEHTVLDEAIQAFEQVIALEEKEHQLVSKLDAFSSHDSPEYNKLLADLDHIHHRLVHLESHLIKPKAEAVLTGLGFDASELNRTIGTFSGGWRMRASLARLLLNDPDILLLDEPTNHLDIDSIDWLENYLRAYRGSVIIVSHDRYFLDRMVTNIAELSEGRLTEYAGNYEYYLTERTERRKTHRATWENQQKMIADTERFIERFRAKSTKARQVQSRIKKLDNLERIPPPPADEASIAFRFPDPSRSNRTVVDVSVFSKTYVGEDGDINVFENAGPLLVERGDRIALIGQNGAGKSTLARILQGTEPFEGSCTLGSRSELTFFSQNQAETLPANRTVYEVVHDSAYGQSETWIRNLLGTFLFHGDDVFKMVSVLSGGERSRIALAKTLVSPANFLILDEPTNHLDILSRQVLVEALRQYSGTFIVVSHDRHFLDQIVKKVWRVENGTVREFHGNYSDYLWQIQHGTASRMATLSRSETRVSNDSDSNSKRSGGPKTRKQKREEADARKRKTAESVSHDGSTYHAMSEFQLNRLYKETEIIIFETEEEYGTLESQTADRTLYDDTIRARVVTSRLHELQTKLKALYETWELIAEERESRQRTSE